MRIRSSRELSSTVGPTPDSCWNFSAASLKPSESTKYGKILNLLGVLYFNYNKPISNCCRIIKHDSFYQKYTH